MYVCITLPFIPLKCKSLKYLINFIVGRVFFRTKQHFVGNLIGREGRVLANGTGDLGSIPGHVIPKSFKMVLDTSLLNTQWYKVRIKCKAEKSKERCSALPYTSV